MDDKNRERGIIYIGDPMCSWCWGFSPVVDSIIEHFAAKVPVFIVVGGLRVGNSEIMNDGLKGFLRHHWEQVSKYTGQPFSFGFMERKSFIYDTGPSCRATVTMRLMNPEFTFLFFKSIQHAFYVENRDPTSPDTFADLAESFFKIDRGEFLKTFDSDRAAAETLDDFRYARTLGITGFPSVLLKNESGYALLTNGYKSFEKLKPQIESWLKRS